MKKKTKKKVVAKKEPEYHELTIRFARGEGAFRSVEVHTMFPKKNGKLRMPQLFDRMSITEARDVKTIHTDGQVSIQEFTGRNCMRIDLWSGEPSFPEYLLDKK